MSSETSTNTIQPWQFFVLAALGCATAVTFLVRERGVSAVVLLTAIMGATALVGLAVLRVIRPLLNPSIDRQMTLGQRTRASLEQEKLLALKTIKELEFDRAMGKVSDEDFNEMSVRLRARAARLIKQLDAGDGYRQQIERELAKRLGEAPEARREPATCAACQTVNDPDARFCKECGAKV
jgi:parvulin-like peptidyl-prolyl isomerase